MTNTLPHRRLILLAGFQEWGIETASALIRSSALQDRDYIWIKSDDSALDFLGQERALIIVNAYLGLNPDVLGRVSGLIQAGGALLIICPEFDAWASYADPELSKMAPHPLQANQLRSPYLERFIGVLQSFKGFEHYRQKYFNSIPSLKIHTPDHPLSQACTEDQQRALDAIIKTASGQRRRPVFIKADRGRGKSAALGLAAGTLIAEGKAADIIVTAHSPNQLGSVFKHAQAVLPDALDSCGKHSLKHRLGNLRYISVDSLIEKPLKCDLLIVDEASALGVAKLEALLRCYPRIAFSGTEHGYEGSGRGFSLKFRQLIQRNSRGHVDVELRLPVRWASNDPLEKWTNRLLLLDAAQPAIDHSKQLQLDDLTFSAVESTQLVHDESLLEQAFGLLINAHYQTRPIGCRQLLYAPNSHLFAARHNGRILGLIWLMFEGGLEGEMARDIVAGKRRPQGHRVPQILAAHLGLGTAASLRCARIQRIVVHPQMQRQGIGKWMLKQLEHSLDNSIDYLASSFGAELQLARFWRHSSFDAVRVSDRVLTSSGLRSVVFLKAFSAASQSMLDDANTFFAQQYITQLADGLNDLSPELAYELAPKTNAPTLLNPQEIKAAVLFAYGNRPFESSLAGLRIISINALITSSQQIDLGERSRSLLISRLLQHQSWKACASNLTLSGRNECLSLLRKATRDMLSYCCSDCKINRLRGLYGVDTVD